MLRILAGICHAESLSCIRTGSDDDFREAVSEAVQQTECPFRTAYTKAVQKTTGSADYEVVLWAVADGAHLSRQFQDIYGNSYVRIMGDLERAPLAKVNRSGFAGGSNS